MQLTPITNTNSVLFPCVKHQTDNHEARRDGTFTHAEDETDNEETGEVLASGMTTQSNSPDKDVQTRGVLLQRGRERLERVQPTSSTSRQETSAGPSSAETRRRDS
jgi:hypothetical protein